MTPSIELRHVDAHNWRACADLEVALEQRDFVAPSRATSASVTTATCGSPLAVYAGDEVVGFVMWAVDPGDQSGWIGGLVIDQARQRRGYGRATVEALTRRLLRTAGCDSCALSYSPENTVGPGACTPRSASSRPASRRTTSSSRALSPGGR